jgi:predicted secreted Zn-dependent protease
MRVSAIIPVLLVLISSGLWPASVGAEPVVSKTMDYYDVTGTTPQQVRASLDQLGPTSTRDGRRYDSLTYEKTAWRFTFRGLPNCAITGVTVTTQILIRFPRLVDASAPLALQKAFAAYTDKLMAYENGHIQRIIDTARQIEIGIGGLPPIQDCRGQEKSANHLGHNLLKNLHRWRQDYADRTLHGRTLGAKFP